MPDAFDDKYLNMKLEIPRDGYGPEFYKVTKRLRDKDGMPIGRDQNNPTLSTGMYEVEYKDGQNTFLEANAIAENMFSQADGEGNLHVLF